VLKFEHFGKGMAKGMATTLKHLLRKPITTQYPEEKLVTSRRIRGTELVWYKERCTGCTLCERACPHHVITITHSPGAEPRFVPAACPAHVDAARYVRLIAQGKPAQALAVVRERIPFPSVCGLVCIHPCEAACTRGLYDENIMIRILKRYAFENDSGLWKKNVKTKAATGHRVAVVGAGPAGLTAAYYLARLGHTVTAFDALPRPGGMMLVGIPDYRLPKDVLRAEIQEIINAGVEIITSSRITSLESLTGKGYEAVFLALGAHQNTEMGIPGEEGERVMQSGDFLKAVNLGQKVKLGKRVAIVGGGNAAMDAARTARRLGAEVTVIYRRNRSMMPATDEEVVGAMEEGIDFRFLEAPTKITTAKDGLEVEIVKMKLGALDSSGRRRPEPLEGSQFTLAFDNVIAAIGQKPEIPQGNFSLEIGKGNTITVNPDTMATSRDGVFAGGDVVSGPASNNEAIAAGRKAATAIDKYLGGDGDISEKLAPGETEFFPPDDLEGKWRPEITELPAEERIKSFEQVEKGLDAETAVNEARRCMRCDLNRPVANYEADMGLCIFCGLCVEACPYDANAMGYVYENSEYQRGKLLRDIKNIGPSEKRPPSGYCRPLVEESLPEQTLLIDRKSDYFGFTKKK